MSAAPPGRRLTRRRLLVAGGLLGGGLLVAHALRRPEARERVGRPADFPAPAGWVALNGWVHVARDGRVRVAMPRAEMGQGTHTGLAVLVAEELDAAWAQVDVTPAPLSPLYANAAMFLNLLPFDGDDEDALAHAVRGATLRFGVGLGWQVTGGSASVRDAWEPLRLAGATARQLLVHAAARRHGLAPEALRTADGAVWQGARRLDGYGELADAAAEAAGLAPPAQVPLKPRRDWTLIGRSPPRLDLPGKVQGTTVYGIDERPEGLLHAAVRRAPVRGGRVARFDAAAAGREPGVQAAWVLDGDTAVVVADRWWRAERVLRGALAPEFEAGAGAALDSDAMRQRLREALDGPDAGFAFRQRGDVAAALAAPGARVLRAEYELPFLAHATLEPQNATALWQPDGGVTLWLPTQAASVVRWKIAQRFGLASEQVTVHVSSLGGGFGRRLETDVAEQAVSIAQRVPGRPVKLLWTREEDFTQGVYRPMGVSRFEAVLDAAGRPLAWRNRLAGPSIGQEQTARIAAWAALDAPDKNHLEGAFELPYALPNLEVRQLRVPLGLPVGSWRSVGHSLNGFFTECFLDELAQAAGQDPVAYRDALLAARPRHRAVLRRAAEHAGWGQPLPPGVGRGVALHESFGSLCAQVVEATLEDGAVRVQRVVVALDAGTVVHPDAVRAQVEGSVVFALSAALHGEITVRAGAVQERNFPQQPLLTLARTPRIEVLLMPSDAPPGGVGEPAVPPLAPALANALSRLTGTRIRRLPIRP